jgi:hypothetical protein
MGKGICTKLICVLENFIFIPCGASQVPENSNLSTELQHLRKDPYRFFQFIFREMKQILGKALMNQLCYVTDSQTAQCRVQRQKHIEVNVMMFC